MKIGSALPALGLVVACGGQSLEGDPIDRGFGGGHTAGAGGGTGKGGASAGTSMTGGSAGIPTMPGSGGNAMMGGSGGNAMTGGSGGMPPVMGGSGGASTAGGAAGIAGQGICDLPLVMGTCDALIRSYGFDTELGHCARFTYYGCDGNENRFETLGECEAACGGSTLAGCPEDLPTSGTACAPVDHACHYSVPFGCLCVPSESGTACSTIDRWCGSILNDGCIGDDCIARLVAATRTTCNCIDGSWACGPA